MQDVKSSHPKNGCARSQEKIVRAKKVFYVLALLRIGEDLSTSVHLAKNGAG
jgi:hypothetical protein